MDWSEVFSISIYHGYIPQIILAEALYVLRLPRRSRFWVRFGVGLPVCTLLAIVLPNMVAQLTAGFFSIIIFLLTFGLCCLLFKSKWTQVLFCCVSAQFTQNLSYNIEGLIEMPISGGLTLWGMFGISVGCMAVVYPVCYFVFARRIRDMRIDAKYVLPMAVATCAFVYVMQFLLQLYEIDGLWVSRLPLIACCIFGLCMQYNLLAYKDEQAENERLEYFLRQESKQYEITRHSIDLINMKAHDLKHYLARMSGGAYSAENIAEMSAAVAEYESTVNCGNSTLDVILTEKQYRCEKNGIHLSMMVQGEELQFIHSTDLVAIFSNALENAIECELGVDDAAARSITLRAVRKGDMVVVHVENYCPHPVAVKDGLPVTSKGDTDFHGFGTRSMRYAVKKYGGEMQLGQRNGRFELNILIPCPEA